MKLGLISPKGVFFSIDKRLSDFFKFYQIIGDDNILMPSYEYWSGTGTGLLIVAALTPPVFEIDFIDENYEEINFDADYNIVAISAMTQQATRAYEIADEFRSRGVKVAIGGIHATVLPDEAKGHADAVIIGEAENTWPEFISDFAKGVIKPYYRSTTLADLTKSPLPRYDLFKKYNYKSIWVQTTRGCPRGCEFCVASNVYGKAYRHKTAGQVLGEVNYIRSFCNEPVINFADDNMFVDRAYSHELIGRLAQAGLRWRAQSDVSIAEDDAFLRVLQNSGCILLFIGFETLSKDGKIDPHGWKQSRIETYPESIKKIQSKGIGVFGTFIVGLDEDDTTVFDKLSDFIINNRLFAAQVTVLTPLPGTQLRVKLLKEDRILSSDWKMYTFNDVNILPKRMTPEDLKEGILNVYKKIYNKSVRLAVIKHFKEIHASLHTHNAI